MIYLITEKNNRIKGGYMDFKEILLMEGNGDFIIVTLFILVGGLMQLKQLGFLRYALKRIQIVLYYKIRLIKYSIWLFKKLIEIYLIRVKRRSFRLKELSIIHTRIAEKERLSAIKDYYNNWVA